MEDPARISVLICTCDRCDALKRCLKSILDLEYPLGLLEVIVLDDMSRDATPVEIPACLDAMSKAGLGRAVFLRGEKKYGIAAGRRFLGGQASPGPELLLFMDDDVCLERGCLKALCGYAAEHPEAGIVGPRIVRDDAPEKALHLAYFISRWSFRYSTADSAAPMECDWVDPACILVRSAVIKKTGGFWPGFYRSHEGVDLCLRAAASGYKVIFDPSAAARHIMRPGPFSEERLYYVYRNKFLLIKRNAPFLLRIFLLPALALFGLPFYLAASVRTRKKIKLPEFKIILAAVLDGLAGKEGPLAADGDRP